MRTALAALVALLLSVVPLVAAGAPPRPLVLDHVTVVNVAETGPPCLPDRTVVIAGGRIVALDRSGAVATPAGAQVVDATGRFLIPGLWDMHAHCGYKGALPLFLANGVTGVRVMWGNPLPLRLSGVDHFRWRRQIDRAACQGRTPGGPRLVIGSNILDGPKPFFPTSRRVTNPEQARDAVRDAAHRGADFVKVYSFLPRDAYCAIAEEARARAIPLAGHVPFSVRVAEASCAGQRSIEHLLGVAVACSRLEDQFLTVRRAALESHNPVEVVQDVIDAQQQSIAGTYDEGKAADLFRLFIANRTWHCPTLIVQQTIRSRHAPDSRRDWRRRFVPIAARIIWDSPFAQEQVEDYDHLYHDVPDPMQLVRAMHRAGVGILAGTDEGTPNVFPGFSLHDELALLVQAGLTPRAALRAATLDPARFLGCEGRLGTVEAGKEADLVLLDANPLEGIGNTQRIGAVVVRGHLLDRADLNPLLDKAEWVARLYVLPVGP